MKVCTDASMFGVWTRSFVESHSKVLDIGTGTGLLSLLIASTKNVRIDAVEVDEEAADQAAANFSNSEYGEKITVFHSDIKDFHPAYQYDWILSNPPFFDGDLQSPNHLSNLAKHSTDLNLEELFDVVSRLLKEDGSFSVLLPYIRKQELMQSAANAGFYPKAVLDVKQTQKHPFFRTMVIFKRESTPEPLFETMHIQEGAAYSESFKHLMKNVYFKSLD